MVVENRPRTSLAPIASKNPCAPDGSLTYAQGAFDEETLTLQPGDVVVVFSDGVTEAFDEAGVEFTDERLQAAVMAHRGHAPRAWLDALVADVRAFCGHATPSDDLTTMVVRYDGSPREEEG